MNWDAVGAVGEVVGAVAVVLSLIYLAIQVRQNTRTLRRSATADSVAGVRDFNSRLIGDPTMTRIFRRGLEGMDDLDPDDRAQFIVFIFNLFKTFEDLHYQFTEGGLDPAIWEGWERLGRAYLASAGCRQYWEERRPFFNRKFQTWVDSLEPGLKTIADLAEGR